MDKVFSKAVVKAGNKGDLLESINRYYIDKESGKDSSYKTLNVDGTWCFG